MTTREKAPPLVESLRIAFTKKCLRSFVGKSSEFLSPRVAEDVLNRAITMLEDLVNYVIEFVGFIQLKINFQIPISE